MKANVQYNDLVGTAAADVSDFYQNSLENYLQEKFSKFDAKRYNCYGCTINVSGQNTKPVIVIHFVCYDKEQRKYVKLCPHKDMHLDEVFSLFKRFNVVIGNDIEGIDVKGEDWIELE